MTERRLRRLTLFTLLDFFIESTYFAVHLVTLHGDGIHVAFARKLGRDTEIARDEFLAEDLANGNTRVDDVRETEF